MPAGEICHLDHNSPHGHERHECGSSAGLDWTKTKEHDVDTTEQPTTIEALMADFLLASQHHIRKSFDPATPKDDFTTHCGFAHAYALVAYLLDAHQQTGDDTTELAWELHEFAQNGEPLADWVNEQVQARGVEVRP